MALTREALRQYLEEEIGVEMDGVGDRDALLSSGLIDSFSMVEVIAFVEREARIRFHATDVSMDNLDSMERILNFAASRSG